MLPAGVHIPVRPETIAQAFAARIASAEDAGPRMGLLVYSACAKLAAGEAPTMDTVVAIRTRRSVRSYQERAVDRSLIEEVIRDAAHAPTTPLSEPQVFTVVEGAPYVAACGDRAVEYARRNRPDGPGYDWVDRPGFSVFHGAPAVIVISAPAANSQSFGDCVRSGQNLLLSAHARGLGACWVGAPMLWLQDPDTKAELGIQAQHRPFAAFAIGYPGEVPSARPSDLPRIVWIDCAGQP